MTFDLKKVLLGLTILLISVPMFAQQGGASGSYSPYSIYGIGDLAKEGNVFTKSMGGVGIATRNKRFINTANPAAVTARDSLAFMADFGLAQTNKIYHQNIAGTKVKSASNTFNIQSFTMSFPIYKSSAFMVGFTPFSDLGYAYNSYVEDKDIIGITNNISYQSYGEGGIHQAFVAAAVTFWKKLSLGVQGNYYFGAVDKVSNQNYTNASIRSINSGNTMSLRGVTGKFGLQFEQKLGGDVSMILGATYRMKTNVKGYSTSYRYATTSGVTDSLRYVNDTLGQNSKVAFADEIGVGLTVKSGDKWTAEFNYLRAGWDKSNFDNVEGLAVNALNSKFCSIFTNSFRAGFEITPNRDDVRYYLKRCTYRAGAYHEQMYYMLDGNNVTATGITLGITLPVYRLYNGVSLGVDFGKKGSTKPTADKNNSMIREDYVTFNIGFNIHDIWFRRIRYE